MTIPKVSVLMPAYNADKYIVEAIESILNQTFTDFEFIIIDDCSTDKTWEIIQEYTKKDKRILAIKNEKNLGIAGNRNKLKKLAKGEYVMWQDADDISIEDRMQRQVDVLDKASSVGIVGGYLQIFDETGDLSMRKYDSKDSVLRKNIFRYSPVAQPASMIRKNVLDQVGDYDLNYPPAEDLDMSFRIGKNYKFSNVQKIVLRYRETHTGATFTSLKKMELSTISIRLRYSNLKEYNIRLSDHIYNILQYISIFIIPPKLKIALFGIIRNTKK
jgi:glycosyltransferase involved in cell wall biosynthesis